MSNYRSRLRQTVLAILLFVGGGLMVAGIVLDQATISVAGAGAWVLVAIALLWSMRFRLDQASQETSGLRNDIVRVRRSQLLMHGRASTRLREQRTRLERIRESQLKLHSRVALQGVATARQQESLIDQVRDLLEESRQAGNDSQRLTLRAYRESYAEWTRVGASLADLGERHREQRQSAAAMLDQLHVIAGEVEKSPVMLDRLTGDTRASLEQVLALLAEVGSGIQRISDGVRSGGEKADRSARVLEKTEAVMDDLGTTVAALEKSWAQGKATIVRTQQKSKREISQSLEALSQLNKLAPLEAPYPLLDDWAMDPVSMLSLLEEVFSRKPRLILECGSGTSSIWLAAALRQIGSGRLVSLDHLEDYARATREALVAQGLGDIAEVRSAPLVQVAVGDEAVKWYDPATVSDLSDIDFLVVDGPPKSTGKHARYPALPLMVHRLQAGALIVLDDTDRSEERQIIERWQDSFPEIGPQRSAGPRTTAMEWHPRPDG